MDNGYPVYKTEPHIREAILKNGKWTGMEPGFTCIFEDKAQAEAFVAKRWGTSKGKAAAKSAKGGGQ